MKTLLSGNTINKTDQGENSIELLTGDDTYSTVDFNRPIRNLYENSFEGAQYDLMIPYCCSKGKEYWISLYTTTDVNCGDIAFHFGGGGHPQAAGFTAKKVKLYERFGKRYIKFTV